MPDVIHHWKIPAPASWVLMLLCIAAGLAKAQDVAATADDAVLRKDIEILVDVSGSMHPETAKEAVNVVADLIRGQFRRQISGRMDLHDHWRPFENEDAKMLDYLRLKSADHKYHFTQVDYFRRLFTGEGEVEPLAGDFDQINMTFFGDRSRTLDPSARISYRMGELHRMGEFTATQEFRDHHTSLRLALAQIRSRKGSQGGYYLFVISDCQDDAEREEEDQLMLGNWGPERFSREDHVVAVLAHQPPGLVGKKTKPYICMVTAGFDPVVEKKKEVAKEVPKVEGAITLLGGLASEIPKVFTNQVPFLAWQVERAPGFEEKSEDYKFHVSLEDRDAPESMVYAMNEVAWQGVSRISLDEKSLFDDPQGRIPRAMDLPEGNWIVTVKEQNGRLKTVSGTIVVAREQIAAMPIAILAGATSLLLFAYSWWAVRQRRPAGVR